MIRYLLPVFAFLGLIALFWVGLGLNPRELPSPLVGRSAPIFDLPDLIEPEQRVSQHDLSGEVTLFNVFASWCVSCRREHPLLVRLSEEEGVRIIGLNYKDEREAALDYLTHGGNPYHKIGFDPRGDVGIEWGVYGTPETFIVDRHGIVHHKHTGPLHPALISETLLPLIRRLEQE